MDSDLDQVLVTLVAFFAVLGLLLFLLDHLETSLGSPRVSVRGRPLDWWRRVVRSGR